MSISNLNLGGLADGTLTYSVTASDVYGNTSAAVTSSVLKDTVVPTVTLTQPGVVNKANQSSFTVSGSDRESGAVITPATVTDGNGKTVKRQLSTAGSNGVFSDQQPQPRRSGRWHSEIHRHGN